MDGGFTRWNQFEPLEEGWKSHLETGLLCRNCNAQYENMVRDFLTYV